MGRGVSLPLIAIAWALAVFVAVPEVRGDAAPAAQVQQTAAPVPNAGDSSLPRTALGDQPLRAGGGESKAQSVSLPGVAKAPSMDYQRVVFALLAVIALIFVLRALGRFFFPSVTSRGQSRVVEVLSRSALAPKQQVMLLRVGRRVIVVGDSGTQMNTLCEISDPDEVAGLVGQLREEKTAAAAAFSSLFGRFNRRFGPEEEREESSPAAALRDEPEEPSVRSAQGELDGLRERVRLLAEQFSS
jgi:flagellar biogenesis protein FliO